MGKRPPGVMVLLPKGLWVLNILIAPSSNFGGQENQKEKKK